jgi:hypothetical protein
MKTFLFPQYAPSSIKIATNCTISVCNRIENIVCLPLNQLTLPPTVVKVKASNCLMMMDNIGGISWLKYQTVRPCSNIREVTGWKPIYLVIWQVQVTLTNATGSTSVMLAGPPNLFAAVDLSNYLQQPVS